MTQGPVIPPPPPPNGMPGLPSGSIPVTSPLPPPNLPGTTGNPDITAPAPGERPRRARRTREQMEADRAGSVTATLPPPPPPPADNSGQVHYTEPVTVGTLRPQTTPPPNPVEGNVKPKFWASAGATINIGNYESFKIDMGVSGIDYDASSEEIERIMASADVGIHETIDSLMMKVIERGREIKIARGIPVPNEDD